MRKKGVTVLLVIMCVFLTVILIGGLIILAKNQHYLTHELIDLNETDYAYEAGYRYGRWVCQYHYDDWLPYDEINPISIPRHSLRVKVEDLNADRKCEICITVDSEDEVCR